MSDSSDSPTTFERWDGKRVPVGACSCAKCKNFWWFPFPDYPPAYCCYCGIKFDTTIQTTNEEMDKHQNL